MKALVTGITGQDAYYLSKILHAKGIEVYGLIRGQQNPKREVVERELPFVKLIDGDLTDAASLNSAVLEVLPDQVYNLGAITYIPFSWQQPELTYNVNFLGVQRLMDALVRVDCCKTFIQASTSEMYGHAQETFITEATPLKPISPYAIAKTAAHHLVLAYKRAGKLNSCGAIMFNHESERRPENFVTRKITASLARIAVGKQNELHLGNGQAVRDWGYAPEYMQALSLLGACEENLASSYVIATGQMASVKEFAEYTADFAGVDRELILFDEELYMRQNDVTWLRGSPIRIKSHFRWSATTNWKDLAKIMYLHDLAEVSK